MAWFERTFNEEEETPRVLGEDGESGPGHLRQGRISLRTPVPVSLELHVRVGEKSCNQIIPGNNAHCALRKYRLRELPEIFKKSYTRRNENKKIFFTRALSCENEIFWNYNSDV